MQLRQIARLDEWYRFDDAGPLFITGLQALVRLLLAQSHRDRLAGLNTAGFVSGYRGSPLGGFDRELWRAGQYLDAAQIRFQPGLNEDLAATSIWGAQQANLFAGARYDGVFGMWYGKGPGRRPFRRSVQARQRGRNVALRRRASRSPATTTRASRRRCRTRASTRSSMRRCRC